MLADKLEGNTLRTRLVMVGVFIGAIIALSLNVAFSSGSGGSGGADGTAAAKAAFQSPAGSCLFWAQPDASDIHIVPCDQPHLDEVTGVVNIAGQYGPGVPEPTTDQWLDLALSQCSDGAQTYLGKPLDPYGKFSVSGLRPSAADWAGGDREMRCVLQWAAPGGALQPVTGKAADQSQAPVFAPGTCLSLINKSVGNPIDCAQPHAYEIIATVDLKTHFTGDFPTEDDQSTWLDTQCNNAVQSYAGGLDLAARNLIVSWDTRQQESWDAGSTLVNCKVGAKLPDNSGLQAITGSIKTSAQGAPQPGGSPSPNGQPPAGG